VAALSKKDDRLRLLHSINRLGKGKAVKRGIESAKGDTIVFMDVDLSANLKSLSEIVRLANVTKGLVIGSRHIKGSRVRRSLIRTISSLTYNLIVRLVFQDGVRDHQCGFKAMNREVAEFLRKNARAEGFFLDTEMVLLCRIHDIRVTEVAVDWTEVRKRKSQGVGLFKDATKLGFDLFRFRLAHLNLRLPKQSGV
jgi:glycosyltransferase involved in cell wall biosynthesis